MAKLVGPGEYTTTAFARKVGVSIDTVKRWRKLGALCPHRSEQCGATTVHVYTEEDVTLGRLLKDGQAYTLHQRLEAIQV